MRNWHCAIPYHREESSQAMIYLMRLFAQVWKVVKLQILVETVAPGALFEVKMVPNRHFSIQ